MAKGWDKTNLSKNLSQCQLVTIQYSSQAVNKIIESFHDKALKQLWIIFAV